MPGGLHARLCHALLYSCEYVAQQIESVEFEHMIIKYDNFVWPTAYSRRSTKYLMAKNHSEVTVSNSEVIYTMQVCAQLSATMFRRT